MTTICDILEYIRSNDTKFMKFHAKLIKDMYEIEEMVYYTYRDSCKENTTILDFISSQVVDWDDKPSSGTMSGNQEKRLSSLKFIVDNKIIDPNFIFTAPHGPEVIMTVSSEREILLTKLLISYYGFEYELQRVDYIFEKTSLDLIRDFRDEYGASVGHFIFYANVFPPEKIAEKWFNILEEAKFDWLCETTNEKQNLLILAVNNLKPKWVKFLLGKGLDTNCVWGNDRKHSNSLQYMLYNNRTTKKREYLDYITQITELLIDAGIDLTYIDDDGRNVMDYLHHYGWDGTETYKVIKTFVDININR
jgi:hypothetical protein